MTTLEVRSRNRRWSCALVAGLILFDGVCGADGGETATSLPPAAIRVAGPMEVVFDSREQKCPVTPATPARFEAPDAPPRMLRDEAGTVLVYSDSSANRLLVAQTPSRFARAGCEDALPVPASHDPADFADSLWLWSPYSEDGRHVFALMHSEYHGWLYDDQCPRQVSLQAVTCWYGSTVAATSEDGGRHFRLADGPDRVVVAPQFRFERASGYVGTYAPTNIVRSPLDGRYAFLVRVTGHLPQKDGTCLFRADRLSADAWRGWDGQDFRVRMGSPYQQKPDAPFATCVSVMPDGQLYDSLTYNTRLRSFVAIGSDRAKVFYRISPDLIQWSAPVSLMEAHRPFEHPDPEPGAEPVLYFSLLDPASSSRNFDISGERPYLYFVRYPVGTSGNGNSSRQIARVPLEIGVQ